MKNVLACGKKPLPRYAERVIDFYGAVRGKAMHETGNISELLQCRKVGREGCGLFLGAVAGGHVHQCLPRGKRVAGIAPGAFLEDGELKCLVHAGKAAQNGGNVKNFGRAA